MGSDKPQQAMTSERLAEIREHVEMAYQVLMADDVVRALMRNYPDLPHDFTCAGDDLLAEVERLRAENGELRKIAACLPTMFAAFQQRHNEKASGGAGG